MEEDIAAIVIDNGSCKLKAGFSGDDEPRAVFPPIVGKPKQIDATQNIVYVGRDAQSNEDALVLKHAFEDGNITSWDDMEKIWHHTFYNELLISPEEQSIFVTEPPLNRKATSMKMTEIMFETFSTPAFYVAVAATLAIFAAGRGTGIVLDAGHGVSHIVPVYQGWALPQSIRRVYVAGRDLTDYLTELLDEKGYRETNKEIVCDIKEKLGYTAENYDSELLAVASSTGIEKQYELPDGQLIKLGNERFRCSEPLFNPSLIKKESPGVHKQVYNSIQNCDEEIRCDLWVNIVLTGGSTMFPGFSKRLNREMINLQKKNRRVKVVAPPERDHSAWIGGSILSSLSTFQDMFITKNEYDETGPVIVQLKCY